MNIQQKVLIRQFIRWSALLMFFVVAFLYFNSAIYSAWVSGGPPTDYPVGWGRRALAHLCFSMAALFIGIGIFVGGQTFPKVRKSAIVFVILSAAMVLSPYVGRYVLIDTCLDRGGQWNYENIQCSDE